MGITELTLEILLKDAKTSKFLQICLRYPGMGSKKIIDKLTKELAQKSLFSG